MPDDYLDLGGAPSDEDWSQRGMDDNYAVRARRECRALIHQFKRICGDPPPGAYFRIHENPHDFGTYLSVAFHFDPDPTIPMRSRTPTAAMKSRPTSGIWPHASSSKPRVGANEDGMRRHFCRVVGDQQTLASWSVPGCGERLGPIGLTAAGAAGPDGAPGAPK